MAVEIKVKNRKFHVPESDDSCNLWTSYFKQLKEATGHENAKMLWLLTWKSNGSKLCSTNAEFNRFLKKNDIDVSSATTRAIADLSAIGGNLFGLGKKLTKTVSVGLPMALVVILAAVLFVLLKTAKNVDAMDVIEKATPMGRINKMMK